MYLCSLQSHLGRYQRGSPLLIWLNRYDRPPWWLKPYHCREWSNILWLLWHLRRRIDKLRNLKIDLRGVHVRKAKIVLQQQGRRRPQAQKNQEMIGAMLGIREPAALVTDWPDVGVGLNLLDASPNQSTANVRDRGCTTSPQLLLSIWRVFFKRSNLFGKQVSPKYVSRTRGLVQKQNGGV